ncbi:MAG TPA: class I SAM-dependent methyltransferase [Bryobacteraceae bacterium]|nr:class I SAM-dependent methyltransferase [Bryobacteraceae bacterium]
MRLARRSWGVALGLTLGLALGLLVSLRPAHAFQDTHPVTGRKYAGVMGADGAGWLVRPEREAEENPEGALDALGLKPGMNVADVGAGVGYMSLRMVRRITPGGKVWANDLQPRMLEMLRANAAQGGFSVGGGGNIETVLGTETDPKLPRNTMDLVLLVDVYHEFSHPREMVRGIRESLKADGRLVLLEYRKEDPKVPIRIEHKMTVEEVKAELEADGFRMSQVIETLPRQHILILTKAAAAGAAAGSKR